MDQLKLHCVRGPNGGEFANSTLDGVITNTFYKCLVRCRGKSISALHHCTIESDLWEDAQKEGTGKRGRLPEIAPYLFRGKVHTDQLRFTVPTKLKGQPVPLVPYFFTGRNSTYPTCYHAGRRLKCGGIKAEAVDPKPNLRIPGSIPA